MGKEKEVYGLSKVPDSVIILTQLEEIKKLKQKNHEIVEIAKEREEHWKAYTEELLKTINGDTDEEKKHLQRQVRAIKKVDEDYQFILEENQRLPMWKTFCSWIESLPFAKQLILVGLEEK